MTLTELKYIIAVARERHFGRAAESCNISQPSLSVAVRKLEEELGVQLFERRSQEIALTPIGESIVEQAYKVLDEVRRVEEIAMQGHDPLCGPLRLGVIFTISPYLTPGLVREMQRIAPKMPLILTENYTDELLDQLRDGKLDVAIMALPINEPGMMLAPLYDEDFVVAVPAKHPWAKKEAIHPDEVQTENLMLLGKGHCLRDQILAVCPKTLRRQSTAIQRTVEGSSLLTIRHMVAQGLGVTVLPKTALNDLPPDSQIAVVPFEEPAPSRRVIIVWRKTFSRDAAIEAVQKALRRLKLQGCRILNLPPVSSVANNGTP
ncbi:MAG: hydrogen peroxide-inducible genes activator [Burkholderiaceae bacterium]|nr:hydrogen peroxide-inducible genes activator [Burkholderiaceae bacterium]